MKDFEKKEIIFDVFNFLQCQWIL